MTHIRSIYNFAHLLSLDVAAGACGGMFFFSHMLSVEQGAETYGVLALAVWCIYTFDHLLDARKTPNEAHSKRHRCHQKYFTILSLALGILGIIGFGMSIYLFDKAFILSGMGLAALIIGSMILIRFMGSRWIAAKEISIAVFYVTGILFAPIWQLEFGFNPNNWMYYAILYLIVALYNLIYLSFLDADMDKKDGYISISYALGQNKTKKILWVLSAIGSTYTAFLFFWLPSFYHIYTLILALMLFWHIIHFIEDTSDVEMVRKKLEAIFLLPWLLVVLG